MLKQLAVRHILRVVWIKSRVLYCSIIAASHVGADPVEGDRGGGGDGGEPASSDESYQNDLKAGMQVEFCKTIRKQISLLQPLICVWFKPHFQLDLMLI